MLNKITFKANFEEARRNIFEGRPVGSIDSRGLVDVPEDLFVPTSSSSSSELQKPQRSFMPFMNSKEQKMPGNAPNLTDVELEELAGKFDKSKGKLKYGWEQIKQTVEDKKKAALLFIGGIFVQPVVSLGNTVKNKVNSIFDQVNDKIENVSLDDIKESVNKIKENYLPVGKTNEAIGTPTPEIKAIEHEIDTTDNSGTGADIDDTIDNPDDDSEDYDIDYDYDDDDTDYDMDYND